MQLDSFVMSALMAFVFLGYGVYVFYMFATPNEKLRQLTASWDIEELKTKIRQDFNIYDHDDPSLN